MMMRARKTFRYNNRKVEAGDVFSLINEHGDADAHRHVLLSAQLAEDCNGEEPKKKRTYKRRDMMAEE
jgi:hypothetical protein